MADATDRAAQSVLETVRKRLDPVNLSVGEVRQFLLLDAEHALAAGHPQVLVIAFDDAVHEAGKEPVVHRVGRELAILQSAQALAGSNPQHGLVVHEQRLDAVGRQAVLRRVRREPSVFETVQSSAARSNPERAVPIFLDSSDGVARQAVAGRELHETSIPVGDQPVEIRADPDRPRTIGEDHPHVPVEALVVLQLRELHVACAREARRRARRPEQTPIGADPQVPFAVLGD